MLLDRVDDPLIQTLFALSPPITTAEVFLDKTPEQLAQLCGASLEAVRRLRFAVARECLPARKCGSPSTGLFDTFAELRTFYRENGAVVSTGAGAVDNILERSIACLEVTEIVGHSLSGKTQMCFTVCVDAAIAGRAALYVDTSNSFSPSRVHGICKRRLANQQARDGRGLGLRARAFCDEPAFARARRLATRARSSSVSRASITRKVRASAFSSPPRPRVRPRYARARSV